LTNAPRGDDARDSRSEIENASIRGDVVQARDVSGGVHFHVAESGSGGARIVPRQLPASAGIFVNRQPEIRTLTRLANTGLTVRASRPRADLATVVVVTGAAGVGKTALALHWAHRIRDQFSDGELYANLRGFDEGSAVSAGVVLDRFLRDLGVAPDVIPADLDGRAALFRSLVADRRVLIVLDNAADIGQVRPLIPGSGGPFVIITSRSQLPGLAIRDGARRIRLDILAESDAIGLLRRVTRTGGRRDAPADLTELAQLCARLPLALRVAAEHAVSRPTMQLAELIADLRDDSMLWDALSVGEGQHAEAVRTVFAWSYRDLPSEAARMFRVLGLHSGPDISLPAAAAACGVAIRAARRALNILLGAYLIEAPRPGRYQSHDLLRAYALDQARAIDPEEDRRDTIDRLLRWYIATAQHASATLAPGISSEAEGQLPESSDPLSFDSSTAALEWFGAERPNLVAGARSALESGLPRRAWELAMVLSPIHASYFAFDDWSVLSELAVAAAEDLEDLTLAAALDNRGRFLFRRGAPDEASVAYSRALSIRRDIGDQSGTIQSLNALGQISMRIRKLSDAIDYFASATEQARDNGDPWWEAIARSNLVGAQLELGHERQVREVIGSLRQFFAARGEQLNEGNALMLLSRAYRLLRDPASALTAIGAALQLAEDLGNRTLEGFWLIEAARVHLALGDTGEAMRCCRMAASLQRQIGDHGREAMALDVTGEVFLAMGNPADASAFHREAARMHRQLGDRWQEALATIHLADAEAAADRSDASREAAAHALSLLQEFTDDQAAQLRDGLEARLG
jgi:tetratricopeptide (TPR) repeat protein